MLRQNTLATLMCLALSGAVIGACGPSTPAKTPDGSGDPEPTTSGGAATATPDAPDTPAPKKELTESSPIKASAMLAEVEALGIDMKKISKLEDIDMGLKKKMMPMFQKALGYEDCTGCHVEGDFKKETKNIKMARGMWNHYIKDLRDEKGGALFCDSCHQENEHVLARGDKDALNDFMKAEYEAKLTRADGEEHSCSTCHTDVFETKIFKDVWGIADAG